VLSLLKPLDHEDSRVATTAERALLRTIEGGCQVPLGALGTVRSRTPPPAAEPNKQLTLHAAVSSHDGARMLRAAGSAPATPSEAERLGQQLAHQLLAQGAAALITTERAVLRSQQDLK